jgi:catechol 2,3-dioxygenase-like lactoylglutathione lyase family enzyme
MTRIRSIVGATRRAGELGVHSLDSFNLIVPDLKVAKAFYEEFGLDLQARGNRFDVHTRGHGHRWGAISEGPRKQLSHLSFGVFDDDFSRFKERLAGFGISEIVTLSFARRVGNILDECGEEGDSVTSFRYFV